MEKSDKNNNNNSKVNNLHKIFRVIQANQSISRKELLQLTDLSWGAVSQFCSSLIQSGVAKQCTISNKAIGKNPNTIQLVTDDYYVIGINMEYLSVSGMVINLYGNTVALLEEPINNPDDTLHMVDTIIDKLKKNYCENKHILSIGISAPGSIDEEIYALNSSVYWNNWNDQDFKNFANQLKSKHKIPTYFVHDTECLLLAEKYKGIIARNNYKEAIIILLDYGVGMAIMHEGKPYKGTHNFQGELGHIKVVPNGTKCNCGGCGCLEMYVSKLGITKQFANAVKDGAVTSVDTNVAENFNFSSIKMHAVQGDTLCLDLFEQCGYLLGNACATAATFLNPDVVILHGTLLSSLNLWGEKFEKTFYSNIFSKSNTKLVYSELGPNAPMLGAALYSFNKIFDNFLDHIISYKS